MLWTRQRQRRHDGTDSVDHSGGPRGVGDEIGGDIKRRCTSKTSIIQSSGLSSAPTDPNKVAERVMSSAVAEEDERSAAKSDNDSDTDAVLVGQARKRQQRPTARRKKQRRGPK